MGKHTLRVIPPVVMGPLHPSLLVTRTIVTTEDRLHKVIGMRLTVRLPLACDLGHLLVHRLGDVMTLIDHLGMRYNAVCCCAADAFR
jgi:hypothetical protein